MPRSPRSRKTASLSQLTHNQLNMYAFAAGAAGVGLLALDVPAEGRVVYTPDNQTIRPNVGFPLDLNHDGITDFVFSNYFSSASSFLNLAIAPVNPSNEIFSTGGGGVPVFAAALPAGKKIGPDGKFQKVKSYSDEMATERCRGPWVHAREKYLGLKFIIEGEVHFGWARLNVNCGSPIKATLTGYAYETDADEPIVAGDTTGAEASVEAGTLGNLALGAAAITNK
jgi:hypothetical protein